MGESVAKPLEYYENNMNEVFVLIDVMRKHRCKNIIFSSSATVYGDPAIIPITKECPKGVCTVSDRLTPSINFQYAFLSLPAKRILWYIGH